MTNIFAVRLTSIYESDLHGRFITLENYCKQFMIILILSCFKRLIQLFSSSVSMSDQDNFYTVQKILARKRTKQGSFCYKIKWKNWPISTSTWQPAEHLQYVKDMVNKYDRFCDMRRGKKRISRHRKLVGRSDEDQSQQKLKKNEEIVGGKKNINEAQINQNQQDNEQNINNGKQKSPIFLIVKNCRNKDLLQNEITKNSNTILDSVLTKQYLKRTIKRTIQRKIKRTNKGNIGRINHMKAVNQMRRERKRRELEKRELEKEQNQINIVDTKIKNKRKRIKKVKKIQILSNNSDQKENTVKTKRKYARRININIDNNRSKRRLKHTIQKSNEENKMEQVQNQQNKTPPKISKKKYARPGRPRKILSEEQLQLRKQKIRVSRKYSKPGRPNVVLSQQEKEKRREMRRLKLRKYNRRGRPKKIQTQQQIQRKKQVLRQRRRMKRRQKEKNGGESEKFQNSIIPILKRTQFSNKKKENYSDVMIKQEVNEADIIKMRQIEQWNSGQNIGFTESNQQLSKLKEINEQSHILIQQSPFRMPIYTPLQAFDIKQGNLDQASQSYPKLHERKRSYRRKINIDKFKRRQNPKRRKQLSFANLFSYERSKDLNQIPKQVYELKSIQKVELKSKEVGVPKDQDSLFQIVQNQTLHDQLFNYNPVKNFSNKTIYQDDKILVQFRNEHDQKCTIEVGELTKHCGDWLKCYYQSYI